MAFSKASFGEGAERFAFRFYELASDARTIVGPPLVAKESRHVLEHGDHTNRRKFVQQFCETQQLSRRIAAEFNSKLNSLNVDKKTPRVNVLDCSIYHLTDHNLGEIATLVEPRLDHNKWHKWNSNNGVSNDWQRAQVLMHHCFIFLFLLVGSSMLNIYKQNPVCGRDESCPKHQSGYPATNGRYD